MKEVATNHDRKLEGLLSRCGQYNVKLNPDKIQFNQNKVPFIGHGATNEDLCVDPKKVRAVLEIPHQSSTESIRLHPVPKQVFTPSIRRDKATEGDNTEGCSLGLGLPPANCGRQAKADDHQHTGVTILFITGRSDYTIQRILGAALLQKDQPVAYASHVLTQAEIHYEQIEKELLAIVFAYQHFDMYIFGK